jgi:hypothetical protein
MPKNSMIDVSTMYKKDSLITLETRVSFEKRRVGGSGSARLDMDIKCKRRLIFKRKLRIHDAHTVRTSSLISARRAL